MALKRVIFSLFVWLLSTSLAGLSAMDIPQQLSPPRLVSDFASILTPEQANALEQKLLAFNDSTSTQIAIVTLADLDGEPASSFAPKLFNDWKIGQSKGKNGVLILVSMGNPREIFINTGYGVEEFIPDVTAGRIVQDDVLPFFRENKYYEGLEKGTDDIMHLLSGTFKGFPSKSSRRKGIPSGVIVVLIIIAVIAISRSKGGGGGRYMRTFGGPTFGGWGGFGGSSGGGFGGGGGGGFGGFGGGSTGGGGAGGSW